MADTMLVTLTVAELEELVRSAVRSELAKPATADSDVLTLKGVASLLQRHTKVVMRLVSEEGLPCVWISEREPRFFRSKVLAWLETRAERKAG